MGRLALPRPVTHRAGRAVRPPGPHDDHPGRRPARRGLGDVRGRPEHLAEPGGHRRRPGERRAGAGRSARRPRRRPRLRACRRPVRAIQLGGPRAHRSREAARPARSGPSTRRCAPSRARCTTWPRPTSRSAWPGPPGSTRHRVPGAAGWTGYPIISGHWYTGPGQAVVSTGFLSRPARRSATPSRSPPGGLLIPVRITGEDFDAHDHGISVLTSWQTLARAVPGLAPARTSTTSGCARVPGRPPYTQALGTCWGPGTRSA